MTAQELNRDIKRLWKRFENRLDNWTPEKESSIKKEFLRLYRADDTASYLNRASILYLLRINHSLRIVPLHHFGIQWIA